MRDPDAIRPHEAASLRARPTLAPEERPPDAVELTLSTITVPEGSEVELLQIATRRPALFAGRTLQLQETAPPDDATVTSDHIGGEDWAFSEADSYLAFYVACSDVTPHQLIDQHRHRRSLLTSSTACGTPPDRPPSSRTHLAMTCSSFWSG
jgi:hypothetical protein